MLLTVQLAAQLGDAAAVAMCVAAAASDLRSLRVPNGLTFGGAALGLALALSTGSWPFLTSALAGLVLGLCALVPAGAIGAMGWGDVKLVAAVGALVRFPLALSALVYTLLWGGVLAIGYALQRGVLGASLRNALSLPRHGRRIASELHRMPYALAIFAGTAHAVAARYVPALALW